MKILIVEDEFSLRQSIAEYFKSEGYICEVAPDFTTASEKISVYKYDCVFLDINLPDGLGIDLIPDIKKDRCNTGIIIISAREELDDRLKALQMGADDYLIKPFHLAELNARLVSLLRRLNFDGGNEINMGELRIIPDEHKLFVNDEELPLTKKEFDLLLFFISNKNKVLTKEAIGEHVWGDYIDSVDSFDFVYTHIKNLRKKIEDKSKETYFKNIYGVGYKFLNP